MYCWDRKNFSWRSFMDYESILLLHRCIWKYDISQNCHVDLEMWYIYISKSQNCDISEMMHSHWMLVSPFFLRPANLQTHSAYGPACADSCAVSMAWSCGWFVAWNDGGFVGVFLDSRVNFDPEKPEKCEFWPWKMWIEIYIYICIII